MGGVGCKPCCPGKGSGKDLMGIKEDDIHDRPLREPLDPAVPLADARGGEDLAHFTIQISKLADFVGVKDGKRHVELLSSEAVHGKTYASLVKLRRRLSQHKFKRSEYAEKHAMEIVEFAKEMADVVSHESRDAKDCHWKGPRHMAPLGILFGRPGDARGLADAYEQLCVEVQQCLMKEDTLNICALPVKIFGDLHGQLRDLLLFLYHYGFPSVDGPTYIFNGDWVDRGRHQLEVLALVYALKLSFPHKVFLNRGNHEDLHINKHMGEKGLIHACKVQFGERGKHIAKCIGKTFEWLPLATLASRRVFVCHGGIGNGQWDLSKVAETKRPLDSEALAKDSVIYNLLWSDPIDEDKGTRSFGVHDSPRDDHAGVLLRFGQDVTEGFCRRNNLGLIVRSHEAVVEGEGYEIMHGGKLMRVFSARDYEDENNDGSIIDIEVVHEERRIVARPQMLHSIGKIKEGLRTN